MATPTVYDVISNLATTMGNSISSVSSGLSIGLSSTSSGFSSVSSSLSTISSGLSTISSGLSDVNSKPLLIATYTLATLPSASANSGKIINVSDATGGAKICQSDGTNWVLINTTTTVS